MRQFINRIEFRPLLADRDCEIVALRKILVAAFGEERVAKKIQEGGFTRSRLEGVTFTFIQPYIGGVSGVQLSLSEANIGENRYRKVMIDKGDNLDLDKLRAKFEELRPLAKEMEKEHAERDERNKHQIQNQQVLDSIVAARRSPDSPVGYFVIAGPEDGTHAIRISRLTQDEIRAAVKAIEELADQRGE